MRNTAENRTKRRTLQRAVTYLLNYYTAIQLAEHTGVAAKTIYNYRDGLASERNTESSIKVMRAYREECERNGHRIN